MTRPAAANLEQDLAAAGFLLLGGFAPDGSVAVPPLRSGKEAKSLLLIGSTGPSIWPHLTASPEYRSGQPDPLDRYTRRSLLELAEASGYEPVFPFEGPPYYPFQQWALKCGGFSQSPMGVLAHHDYGPWSGFRAAFLSSEPLWTGTSDGLPGPCETCEDKPCIAVCPAEALSLETGYDVPACRTHLSEDRVQACWTGCLARRACPVGRHHSQAPDNARFHMESFIGLC
jgi:ferredoxin